MKETNTVTISVLNITMHPHSAGGYVSLLQTAAKSGIAIQVRGNLFLKFVRGTFSLSGKDKRKGIYGEIAKYTDIPKDAKWLNIKTGKEADEADMKAVKIPEDLKPNFQGFTFIFYPENHTFVYEQKNGSFQLSPAFVEAFLSGLFHEESIIKKFGKVDVTVLPQQDKVEEILRIPELKKLTMRITRPNPDDFDEDFDREVLDLLDNENVGTQIIENRAVRGKSLNLNTKTQQLAKVASQNGYVEGEGYDNLGVRQKDSTKNHPFKLPYKYNLINTSLLDAIHAASRKAMQLLGR